MAETHYSPRLRTALVLTGAGTSGAYHAGVLKALGEAGIKIDIAAGHGMGAVSAAFAAVDGAQKLHDAQGLWRQPMLARAYGWRRGLGITGGALLIAAALILAPLLLLVVTLGVYLVSLILTLASATAAADQTRRAYLAMLDAAVAPDALPTIMPRAVVLVLLVALIGLIIAWARSARRARRARGAFWQKVVGAPLSSARIFDLVTTQLWELVRGMVTAPRPALPDLGRRYVELLSENLGQPGFRELLLTAHDIDARRDISISLLAEPHRAAFHERRSDGQPREGETIDLTGVQREAIVTALQAALAVPLVTDPAPLVHPPDSYWRGERHRLVDRPGCVLHLLDEASAAGAEQVIIVSAAPPPGGPHQMRAVPADIAGQSGELVRGIETAALAEAERAARARFTAFFVIRPSYNPIGPFDFGGTDDEASDRRMSVPELMERGYRDAYEQFLSIC